MKFHQLTDLKTKKAAKRKGRGIAAGQGKTAGRGTKGQNSRSGGGVRPYFEGGQTPLVRRLPKLAGFHSHRRPAAVVYSGQLDDIKTNSKIIDNYVLAQAGLIPSAFEKVKIIKKGTITKAHQVQVQAISATAQEELLKAGGRFKRLPRPQRPASEKKTARHSKHAGGVAKSKIPASETNVVE